MRGYDTSTDYAVVEFPLLSCFVDLFDCLYPLIIESFWIRVLTDIMIACGAVWISHRDLVSVDGQR